MWRRKGPGHGGEVTGIVMRGISLPRVEYVYPEGVFGCRCKLGD